MSYGPNLEVYFPRAAILADKIIKGARPAELPIEQPDRDQPQDCQGARYQDPSAAPGACR